MRAAVSLLLVALLAAPIALGAYMWPRDDRPQHPDAVVVLGGGGAERAELGLHLAADHEATLVLASSARYHAAARGDVTCDDADVICFEPDPPTTIGEARRMAVLAQERGWDHVTVATSRFHTSRTRLLFRQCLGRESVTVQGASRPDDPGFLPHRDLREAVAVLAAWTVQPAC